MAEPARNLRIQTGIGRKRGRCPLHAIGQQAAAAVELRRHVKLPQFERRFVRHGEQSLVAVGKRLLLHLSASVLAHQVVAVGRSQCQVAQQRIGSLHLHGM